MRGEKNVKFQGVVSRYSQKAVKGLIAWKKFESPDHCLQAKASSPASEVEGSTPKGAKLVLLFL
jgi:hypothetical protein